LGIRLVGSETTDCRLESWIQLGEEAIRSLVWIDVQDSMAVSTAQKPLALSSCWPVSILGAASCVAQSPRSLRRHFHHPHSTATKKSSFLSCLAFPPPAQVRTFPHKAHPVCSPVCACHHASSAAPLSRSRCPHLQHQAFEPAYRHCSSSSECTTRSWSVQAGPYSVPHSLPAPCDRGSNS
jgi:hypothetical protein